MVSGESGMVDIKIIKDFKHVYTNRFKSYKPEDVFNCDETGLFLNARPIELFVMSRKTK